MKTKFILTLSAATLIGAVSAVHAQSKNQAGGLPALAEEVAALRALVEDLQEQVGGSSDPYAGTYTITLVETALYGCGITTTPPPVQNLPPYLQRQAISSVSVRSATFEAESDGSTLSVPEFNMFTHELRLSGLYESHAVTEGDVEVLIAGDGSMVADLGDAAFTGQFANDGSLFTALVVGAAVDETNPACDDVWTVHLTGVKQ